MILSNAGLDGPVPLLRGCDAAYLDLGTNRGLKIEELLEARPGGFLRLFPPAYRGAANRPCALGAEPNPSHAAHLRTIEATQRAAGRRVTILNAAISNANGEVRQTLNLRLCLRLTLTLNPTLTPTLALTLALTRRRSGRTSTSRRMSGARASCAGTAA